MLIRLYRQHHPYARFGAANYVTLVRALLTGFLLLLATRPPASGLAWIAGWTAGAVAALDGVDGWLYDDDATVLAAIDALRTDRARLAQAGDAARAKARRLFEPRTLARAYIDGVTQWLRG